MLSSHHRGHIKLVDFGFAKILKSKQGSLDEGRTKTNCGTPAYIAPEII